jgi:hypothetical protein
METVVAVADNKTLLMASQELVDGGVRYDDPSVDTKGPHATLGDKLVCQASRDTDDLGELGHAGRPANGTCAISLLHR